MKRILRTSSSLARNHCQLLIKQQNNNRQVVFFSTFLNIQQEQSLKMVLLEGEPIMTSKHKLCDRLNRIGYTTVQLTPHNEHFFIKELLHTPLIANEFFLSSIVFSELKYFLNQFNQFLLQPIQYLNENPSVVKGNLNKLKENVIVIDSTPLTPFIYETLTEKEILNKENNEMKNLFENCLNIIKDKNIKILQCHADIYESSYRLGCHHFKYTEDYKHEELQEPHLKRNESLSNDQYRSKFFYYGGRFMEKELEIVNYCNETYRQLWKRIKENKNYESIIIKDLDTTDIQQACCLLLEKELNITFKLPTRPPPKPLQSDE
ncbi:hypothetical protein ABK040_001150 [Willaertia magna]